MIRTGYHLDTGLQNYRCSISINPISCFRPFHIKQKVKGQRDLYKRCKISSHTDLTAKEFHQRWTVQSWTLMVRGTWWRITCRFSYCVTSGYDGIFQLHNPSGRTMALWSTQSLTEISTRNISWGHGLVRRADNLTTIIRWLSRNLGTQPPGILRACPGLYRDCFTFTLLVTVLNDVADLFS